MRLLAQFKSFLRLSFIAVIMLLNCARIRIDFATLPDFEASNWERFAGDWARTNQHSGQFRLPLQLKWKYNASGTVGTAILAVDGIAYFTTMDGRLIALDIVTGKKIGHRKIGVDATCVYHDSCLFIALRYGDKTLYKYQLNKGKFLWKIDAGDIATEPLVVDQYIIVTALYNHVDLYHISNGVRLWQTKTDDQIRSSPAYRNGVIVFGCDDGNVYAVNPSDGKIRWKFKTSASVTATPAIGDSVVYVGSSDNHFYAIHLCSGKLIWQFATNGQILQASAVNDSLVIFGSSDGQLYCLNRATGTLRWSFPAKSIISTAPLIAGSFVLFGSLDQHYYAIDLATGSERWKYKTNGRVRTAPVIWKNYLIAGSENNELYIFSFAEEK
ncbi:MAG: PQQ-binding-like beta-propeller repeat protein [candidate division KSB1 bacterium]|nr:PQQ-binding-like beta-propeller repeat protein [candidate division KSB1 bacterium]MDZ7399034.1 PQQ-binding-like beta-propeller repeat protein [candidate division KSB1 bacterium]